MPSDPANTGAVGVVSRAGSPSLDSKLTIVFEPDGRMATVEAASSIMDAAEAAGIAIEFPCGGEGRCGRCRVRITREVSEPVAADLDHIGPDDLDAGWRLACQNQCQDRMVVYVPEAARRTAIEILESGQLREVPLAPNVTKVHLKLPAPTVADQIPDFERIARGLALEGVRCRPSRDGLTDLAVAAREEDWDLTAVLLGDELVAIEPGNTARANFGIAFDIGTTTVVGYLHNLYDGKLVAVASALNRQVAYGDDLISRVEYVGSDPARLAKVQQAVIEVLNEILEQVCSQENVSPDRVYEATVVGNTCMTHLFMGLDPRYIAQAPYVPVVRAPVTIPAGAVGLKISPRGRVYVLPTIAGFVGADTVGVLLATGLDRRAGVCVAVDIGTNGEFLLNAHGILYAASCPAGPAWEGARLRDGMRGGTGAIDHVSIGEDDLVTTTIRDAPAVGICGSGALDALAVLLDLGLLDDSGRYVDAPADGLPPRIARRLRDNAGGKEFVLAWPEDNRERPIALTQRDVRELQLAKGAIAAGLRTVLASAGLELDHVDELLIAGGFGARIALESAVRIGLVPALSIERMHSVGNAAGAGAEIALVSVAERQRGVEAIEGVHYVELAVDPVFQEAFMEAIPFET